MAAGDPRELTVVQTREPPMTELAAVKDHAAAVRRLVSWDCVGVLLDEGPCAVVTVLLKDDAVVSASRFCLSPAESVDALRAYNEGLVSPMELRCWQGQTMTDEQTRNLAELTTVWKESSGQRKEQTEENWLAFFRDIERKTRRKGRGTAITGPTRNQVLLDAHGRCMFEGCGADLTEDPVTRVRGNFATLAHNVAASEGGTRGVLYLSGSLSDDPDNILLLCDTHHRLVDTIAKADYPAAVLSAMRCRFCGEATALLDTLALAPTPAFCVAWPVHRQVVALPSSQQVARALKPIGARLDGVLRTVNDNEAVLRSLEGEALWGAMRAAVEQTAADILLQAHGEGYRAALFAMGLMPALIALGAKLGNKCEITPMLRYRENGLWYWPVNEPRGEFYTIDGIDRLSDREGEACLVLGLTAVPKAMRSTAESLGMCIVSVVARTEYLGNGALGHPDDGASFRQRMQELLHRLADMHGVRRVHVLPCASNAACVYFGEAFDSYHPELVIYDFAPEGGCMVPRLSVTNVNNQPEVKPLGAIHMSCRPVSSGNGGGDKYVEATQHISDPSAPEPVPRTTLESRRSPVNGATFRHPLQHASGSFKPARTAIGIDGCPAGWFFVWFEPDGTGSFGIVETLAALVSEVQGPACVLVDIPIGLPDGPAERDCDKETRKTLGRPRGSSVFRAPVRSVLQAEDYEDAKRLSLEATGKSITKQTYGIVPKIQEVDELVRSDHRVRNLLGETHPELCFWAFNNRSAMLHRKATAAGLEERLTVLESLRPGSRQQAKKMLKQFRRTSVRRDDVVDAMVAAVAASNRCVTLRTLPANPDIDSEGLPMRIFYPEPRNVGTLSP